MCMYVLVSDGQNIGTPTRSLYKRPAVIVKLPAAMCMYVIKPIANVTATATNKHQNH